VASFAFQLALQHGLSWTAFLSCNTVHRADISVHITKRRLSATCAAACLRYYPVVLTIAYGSNVYSLPSLLG
jgi:hypothetical protein